MFDHFPEVLKLFKYIYELFQHFILNNTLKPKIQALRVNQ